MHGKKIRKQRITGKGNRSLSGEEKCTEKEDRVGIQQETGGQEVVKTLYNITILS